MRNLYTRKLSEQGFDVHAVKDGAEAWEAYQKEGWDILLLDMDMPEMSGAEVIKLVRENYGRIPIVILSGLDPDDLTVLEEERGADDFVSKHWSIKTLVTRLNKRLRDTLERAERGEQRVLLLSPRVAYDRVERMLIVDGNKHKLKPTLGKVMWMFCTRKNEEVSLDELCKMLWNNDEVVKRDELTTYVSQLRKLLKPDSSISIERGYSGYYRLISPE